MSLESEYVQHLERENETLRERVIMLEQALGIGFDAPLEWGLSLKESKLFGALMARQIVTKDVAAAALYRDQGREEPDLKIIDVFVCKIRNKLKHTGIQISTKWGVGYFLDAETKARVRGLIAERNAA